MRDQTGVRFGLGTGALVLTLLVVAALPLDSVETATISVVAAAVAGATVPWTVAMALGVEAWAFFTGFFENQYGVLTLSPHDLLRLVGFVAVSILLAHLLRRSPAVVRGGDR
jgi:hypothetical protein